MVRILISFSVYIFYIKIRQHLHINVITNTCHIGQLNLFNRLPFDNERMAKSFQPSFRQAPWFSIAFGDILDPDCWSVRQCFKTGSVVSKA